MGALVNTAVMELSDYAAADDWRKRWSEILVGGLRTWVSVLCTTAAPVAVAALSEDTLALTVSDGRTGEVHSMAVIFVSGYDLDEYVMPRLDTMVQVVTGRLIADVRAPVAGDPVWDDLVAELNPMKHLH